MFREAGKFSNSLIANWRQLIAADKLSRPLAFPSIYNSVVNFKISMRHVFAQIPITADESHSQTNPMTASRILTGTWWAEQTPTVLTDRKSATIACGCRRGLFTAPAYRRHMQQFEPCSNASWPILDKWSPQYMIGSRGLPPSSVCRRLDSL